MGDALAEPPGDALDMRGLPGGNDPADRERPAPQRRGSPRRVTKDVTDPEFPHGTERGYFRGCKEHCCVEGKRRTNARRALLKNRGVPLTMPVGPVHAHVMALLAHDGFTVAAVARAADVAPKTVWQITRNDTERVRYGNANRLLALTADAVAAECRLVPSKKPIQQVKSMMRLGHRGQWIGARLGYAESCGTGAPQFVYKRTAYLTRDLADRIDALAREVGDRPGPSPLTAKRAAARGWHVPGAYDDNGDLIPWAVRLDERAEAAAEAREQREQNAERIIALYESGVGPQGIADRTDLALVTVNAVLKARSRRAG